jgi:hypothetical protein
MGTSEAAEPSPAAGLYPAPGLSERLAETGQFPPLMARKLGGRASNGLLIQAAGNDD